MIATLRGTVTEKQEEVIVETGGIGYAVHMPRSDMESVVIGQEVKVHVYEVVREDSYDLYGFASLAGKSIFQQLLGVSGVGPKAALAIMSLANTDQVQRAISIGDTAFIASASGVGKRTAERVAVELRDKLAEAAAVNTGDETDTALQALESLGYSRSVAAQALSKVPQDLEDEARIKAALKEM